MDPDINKIDKQIYQKNMNNKNENIYHNQINQIQNEQNFSKFFNNKVTNLEGNLNLHEQNGKKFY